MTFQAQTGSLKLLDSGDANLTALQAPATQTASVTYTLPTAPTVANSALTSTTGGAMSWTTAGGLTLAAVGASPNANGAVLSAGALTLEPASTSFPGVVTTGTQSLAGTKTFTSPVNLKDTGDANTIALQAPATQSADVTYTLPTAPASTGLFLTSTTGGVMSWAQPTNTQMGVTSIVSAPTNGSTVGYAIGSFTPTWVHCTASRVNASNVALSSCNGFCSKALTNSCTIVEYNIVAGANGFFLQQPNFIYLPSTTGTLITGNVTSFSFGSVNIQWTNSVGESLSFTIFAHA